MVLLTMTPSIVDGLSRLSGADPPKQTPTIDSHHCPDQPDEHAAQAKNSSQTSLALPAVGNPISHDQIIDLWNRLQVSHPSYSLEALLRGSQVFVTPQPPKSEPSDEYKALMARLRHEEATRTYQRMANPSSPDVLNVSFAHIARTFSEVNRPTKAADLGDDDVTYNEVHRQVMLIINFLASIVGVAATLWVTARWWSLPGRLLLTLGGAIVVAIAEVGVYQSYIWRMSEAKSKQKTQKEVKEVVRTWILGQDQHYSHDALVILRNKEHGPHETARRRRRTTAS